jgi:hypothetical protein
MEESKSKFTNLTGKIANVVTAHNSVTGAVAAHTKLHLEKRTQQRLRAESEQNMMKDIPEGGFK